MKPVIIKGIIGAIGATGLAVGGYYGIQAKKSTAKEKPKKLSAWEEFEKTHEKFREEEWQNKYDEFRKGDKFTEFAEALKNGRSDGFVVRKDGDGAGGGVALKGWCEALFKVKRNMEGAKAFCTKLKSPAAA